MSASGPSGEVMVSDAVTRDQATIFGKSPDWSKEFGSLLFHRDTYGNH